uniref:Tail fiber protein n=1 Tax=Salmonella phage Phylax-28 TaxID=3349226 RepID=A0AB74UKS0_9CAUD
MATTPKTVRTFTLDGTKKDFTIPFEYLARKFVVVTLIGATRRELILNTEYRFSTATTITTTKAWGPADNFDLIEIRRLTSATERLVDFADGSILRAYDLNISQVQSLHIAEEARDLTADTIGVNNDGDLDARARRIVNLADGVNDGDAVNLRQQKQWAGSALNQAQASAASASQSAQSAANSQASAVNSASSASSAATSATNSASSASNSATQRAASEAAKTASEAARDLSQAWASKAEDNVVSGGLYSSYHYSRKSAASASASQTSASNSASSASFATTEANRATTQADRAKTEADKLGNANAFMGSLQTVDATNKYVRFMPGWSVRMDRLWVDEIYGMNADKVDMRASATNVWGNLNAYANVQINASMKVTGSTDTYALQVRNGTVQVYSSVPAANAHVWFYDTAGNSRGIVYADQSGQMHIVGSSGAGPTIGSDGYLNQSGGGMFGGQLQTKASIENTGRVASYRNGIGVNASMYSNCHFMAQTDDGSAPAYGFHRGGSYALALYLNGQSLYLMDSGGVNRELLNNTNLMAWLAANMTSDALGCVASMQNVSGANQGQNAVLGGGSLRYSTHNNPSGTAGSGSWRNLGWSNNGGVSNWIRYA